MLVDTHCHLDVWSLEQARALAAQADAVGVGHCLIPAVSPANFALVREMAHDLGYSYALGIHPLYVQEAADDALVQLEQALLQYAQDPRLVALGEIGLDLFVPALKVEPLLSQQHAVFRHQLRLAQRHALPVILHVRHSVDAVLKHLRQIPVCGGIAHAFNGSLQQAAQLLSRSFKLGFGGACTYARAQHLQNLIRQLPDEAVVLETDAPDIPPAWLYIPQASRQAGQIQPPNTPVELAGIARHVAQLRMQDELAWQDQTTRNACTALPRLAALLQR